MCLSKQSFAHMLLFSGFDLDDQYFWAFVVCQSLNVTKYAQPTFTTSAYAVVGRTETYWLSRDLSEQSHGFL